MANLIILNYSGGTINIKHDFTYEGELEDAVDDFLTKEGMRIKDCSYMLTDENELNIL